MKLFGIVALVCCAFGTSSAFAGPKLSVFGVGNFLQSRGSVSETGKLAFGGGAGIEFRLGQRVGFEIDGIYSQFKDSAGATTKAVQIPGLFRFWLGRMFSLGAGGYYEVSLDTDGEADYGAVGEAGFNIPMGQTVALIAEGRYYYGLKDIAGVKYSDIQAVVGLRFGMSK
jgi:hypothetical protein